MISVRFLSPALEEVADAAGTYLAQSPELSRRFYEELDRVVDLIAMNPHLGRLTKGDTRKVTLRRFPYDVVYKLVAGEGVIYAVAHQSRNPDYWMDRL
jgi:toxin ParE1/3/4